MSNPAEQPVIDLAKIESHYRQSPFIADVCAFRVPAPPGSPGGQLQAVVVPDLGALRERRIVNIRELIRFELEGLSISLPAYARLAGFDVTMDPLPRDSSGEIDRLEIADRYRSGRLRTPYRSGDPTPADDHTARIVALVQAAVGPDVVVTPASSLELDLGLDSIDRVELMAALEQRFGVRVPEDIAQCAFLVRDVAEAFRGTAATGSVPAWSWPAMLDVREPGPELQALLEPKLLTAAFVYGLVRVLRAFVRPRVRGLEHLPRQGPFIITPNHQSYIDPLVLESVLPFGVFRRLFFVGAAEYFETPLTARIARALNIVPVDPDANLVPAMQAGAFGLKHGKVLVLFPEGERSIDGRVKAFRKGASILSRHLDAPIVPIAIDGLFEIWPRKRPIDWRRVLPWSRHRVSVRFGPPLAVPRPGTSDAEHTAALHAAVEAMWRGEERA